MTSKMRSDDSAFEPINPAFEPINHDRQCMRRTWLRGALLIIAGCSVGLLMTGIVHSTVAGSGVWDEGPAPKTLGDWSARLLSFGSKDSPGDEVLLVEYLFIFLVAGILTTLVVLVSALAVLVGWAPAWVGRFLECIPSLGPWVGDWRACELMYALERGGEDAENDLSKRFAQAAERCRDRGLRQWLITASRQLAADFEIAAVWRSLPLVHPLTRPLEDLFANTSNADDCSGLFRDVDLVGIRLLRRRSRHAASAQTVAAIGLGLAAAYSAMTIQAIILFKTIAIVSWTAGRDVVEQSVAALVVAVVATVLVMALEIIRVGTLRFRGGIRGWRTNVLRVIQGLLALTVLGGLCFAGQEASFAVVVLFGFAYAISQLWFQRRHEQETLADWLRLVTRRRLSLTAVMNGMSRSARSRVGERCHVYCKVIEAGGAAESAIAKAKFPPVITMAWLKRRLALDCENADHENPDHKNFDRKKLYDRFLRDPPMPAAHSLPTTLGLTYALVCSTAVLGVVAYGFVDQVLLDLAYVDLKAKVVYESLPGGLRFGVSIPLAVMTVVGLAAIFLRLPGRFAGLLPGPGYVRGQRRRAERLTLASVALRSQRYANENDTTDGLRRFAQYVRPLGRWHFYRPLRKWAERPRDAPHPSPREPNLATDDETRGPSETDHLLACGLIQRREARRLVSAEQADWLDEGILQTAQRIEVEAQRKFERWIAWFVPVVLILTGILVATEAWRMFVFLREAFMEGNL
ncbi:MAG: hypothetical protein AAF958_10490 [Planctomycetota bacterium]